jgi:hypothetical protein
LHYQALIAQFSFLPYSYLIISHKTSRWSSNPSNHGVDTTNFTSYQTPKLSWILSHSITVCPKSNLILWLVFMYSICSLIHLLYCSDLNNNRHLISDTLAIGRVISIAQILFLFSTLPRILMTLLKSLAKLLNKLFDIIR